MPPRLSLITEFMEMGSLYYLIHVSGQKKRLSWRRKLKMMCDICRSVVSIFMSLLIVILHLCLSSRSIAVNVPALRVSVCHTTWNTRLYKCHLLIKILYCVTLCVYPSNQWDGVRVLLELYYFKNPCS